jgi:hypothetical protein
VCEKLEPSAAKETLAAAETTPKGVHDGDAMRQAHHQSQTATSLKMEFGFDGAAGVMNRGCKAWREKRGKKVGSIQYILFYIYTYR